MRRRIAFALLCVLCIAVPASASDSGKLVLGKDAIRVGVVFTSDSFNVPDELAELVAGIFGASLSKTNIIKVVSFSQMNDARKTLGFSSKGFSDPQSLLEIGRKADVHFAVQTKIIYDLEKAAKQEGLLGFGKLIKMDYSSFVKREKPKFDVSVIDCLSANIAFDYHFSLDLFSGSMKELLKKGLLNGHPTLGLDSLDLSILKELAEKLAPVLQQAMTEATLLKIQKETQVYEGMTTTAVDILSGKKHDTKDVEQAVVKAANEEADKQKKAVKSKAAKKTQSKTKKKTKKTK